MKTYRVGDILKGKVTGIQPYGVFISLDEQTQGLVHISEITYGFVKNVEEFVKVGDVVKVKVTHVDEKTGKLSLSMRALKRPPYQKRKYYRSTKSLQERVNERDKVGFQSLAEKLEEWIDQSGFKK
ncbi:MAG TPA: S1 domain-containing post-transcriptional regulator GSP13 [Savagea sp.]